MKRKGFTLIEVLVSLCVFLIVFAGVITTYSFSIRGSQKLEEYLYFEKICLDIDKVYDTQGFDAVKSNIFKLSEETKPDETTETKNEEITLTTQKYTILYNANYELTNDTDDVKYNLICVYKITVSSENTSYDLEISINNNLKNYMVIDKLDYGSPQSVKTGTKGDTSGEEQ